MPAPVCLPLSSPAGKFPFWDNVRDCTLQQVWKSILTDKINWSAPALREVRVWLIAWYLPATKRGGQSGGT